jgi:DNA-binding GntR family transcriptional regulator
LEPRLLAASLPRLGEAELAEVAGLEAAFSAAVRAHDVSRWGALNAQLHRSLYRRAELPRTEAIVESLLQASDRYTRLQMNRLPAMARAEAEHRQLLQLCKARRTREACRYLVAHIEQVRQDLHALLKPQPVAGVRAGTSKRTPKPKAR